jgi:PST family polysaccharide transporter
VRVVRREGRRDRSLTARAVNAVGWGYVSGAVFLLAQVGYTALTARLVGPSAFGGYALALTVVQLACLFGAGGLANAVMRTHELTDRGARTALTLAAGSGLLLTLVLFALSAPIQHWFQTPGTAQAIRILAVQPPMLAVAGVSYGLLRREQRYRAASLIDLASCLAGFTIGAAATGLGMGAAGLSLGMAARGLVAMVVALPCVRISLRPAYDSTQARDFSAFSVQVTGQNLGHYGIAYLPLWSVARLAGGAATGLFSRAYQVVALPADQFASGLMRALYPLYREVNTSKDRFGRALAEGLVLTSGACAIVFGTFAALVQPMAIILLGARWHAAAAVAPLLCGFAAVNTQYAMLASAAEAMRWMRLIWVTQLVFLVAMVASLFAASGRLEATAEAMIAATVTAHIFMLVWASVQGMLRAWEIVRAYSIHIALGVILAIVPPLVSRLLVGGEPVPALCVRMAVLIPLGFGLWMLRGQVPGLRLALMRWRIIRPRHVPRHRRPMASN